MSENIKISEMKIPDFIGYCCDKEWELPYAQIPSDVKDENLRRTGAKEGLYPPLYYGGQYPALWKVPYAADSVYYQSLKKNG